MSDSEQMRKIINMIADSHNKDVGDAAEKWLEKISPAFRDAEKMNEDITSAVIGGTVAFVSVWVGEHEVANVGPLDVSNAYKMERMIDQDIERSYKKGQEFGWTDGTGTIYRLGDWETKVETCHSDECSDIIEPRMAAIKARAAKR